MLNYPEELHLAYQKSIRAFANSYPETDEDLLINIDNYCRACALFIWNRFGVNVTMCANSIREIYSISRNQRIYSESQVKDAMSKLSGTDYRIPVPKFFYSIIEHDKNHGTNFSRRLASCFQILNIAYAMIDGMVEKEEIDTIKSLFSNLDNMCDEKDVKEFVNNNDVFAFLENDEDLIVTADTYIEQLNSNYNTDYYSENAVKEKKYKKTNKPQTAIAELNEMIGLRNVKKEIQEIADFVKVQKIREEQGLPMSEVSYHLVFTGNPGTGKTSVARIVSKIYHELGVLSKGHLVETSAKDLIAGYVGQTAIKTGDVIQQALGGVLFIDEAYSLVDKSGQGFGQEAIDTLLKEMEDHRDDLAVIVAGYDDLMNGFINSNPGLKSRFNRFIHFDDYTAIEMKQIFSSLCEKNAYSLSKEADHLITKYFEEESLKRDKNFANARSARNLFESIISKQATRVARAKDKSPEILSTIELEDVSWCFDENKKEDKLEDILKELNDLVGLDAVKQEITDLVYIVQNRQRRKEKGLKNPTISLHLVFTGNPGTGKTTVARLVAKIYKHLGLLTSGHLIETERSGLVAGYVGQTAIKTKEVIQNAIGGVLFIDEAYSLVDKSGQGFGQEAIDTLLKEMKDHRDDLVVIVAGYDNLMKEFINSNPGLESRFNRYIHFEDYSSNEMFDIFNNLCIKNQYELSEDAKNEIQAYFSNIDIPSIGNGRGARNLFEKIVLQQAKRVEMNIDDESINLNEITKDDILNGIQ